MIIERLKNIEELARDLKVVGVDRDKIKQIIDFIKSKNFEVRASELAVKLSQVGLSKEQILRVLRRFNVDDNLIAYAMSHITEEKLEEIKEPKLDFSKYKKERRKLRL